VLAASHFNQEATAPALRALFSPGMVYEPLTARESPSLAVSRWSLRRIFIPRHPTHAILHHTLPRGAKAVLYGNERFPNPPVGENRT
jgi:hypothetical protein